MLGKIEAKGEGVAEDEMVEWDHQLNGHEFEQTLGDSGGREACCTIVHEVAKCQEDWNGLPGNQEIALNSRSSESKGDY